MSTLIRAVFLGAVCSFSATLAAQPKADVSQVFNGEMLGTNMRYFESIAGVARESFGDQQIYNVAGCSITATVHAERISSLRMELSPTCAANLESFIGDFAPPKYRAITFGAFDGLSFYASCLENCGNAADPTVEALWQGPRAAGFTEVLLEVSLVSGSALDAADQWRNEMQASKGEQWIEQTQFNCQREFDQSASQYFKNVTVDAITIGHELRTPKCW